MEADDIEPTPSQCGFPVVLVPKMDVTLSFCVNDGLLNVVSRKDSYTLPRMHDFIDSLGEANVFSTHVCFAGFLQVMFAPEDQEPAAFDFH